LRRGVPGADTGGDFIPTLCDGVAESLVRIGSLGPIPGLRLWQPVTYIFLHGGLWHLLINMLMLWMFGRELELVWVRSGS